MKERGPGPLVTLLGPAAARTSKILVSSVIGPLMRLPAKQVSRMAKMLLCTLDSIRMSWMSFHETTAGKGFSYLRSWVLLLFRGASVSQE